LLLEVARVSGIDVLANLAITCHHDKIAVSSCHIDEIQATIFSSDKIDKVPRHDQP
jgi:hypothetical protein